jgi:hypothetical protein
MVITDLAWALVAPTRAYSADAQIDSFTINYDRHPSGVLKVKQPSSDVSAAALACTAYNATWSSET